jgi:hypothetical protein
MGAADDDQPQNRQRYRRSAVFFPAVIRAGEETYECDVLNVSSGGALVRTRRPFRHSGTFTICIAGLEEVSAQLVRTHENNHGIAFEQDPAYVEDIVRELLMNPAYSRDHRAYPRRLVFLAGSFYLGDRYVRCKLQNLSAGGLFVKSEVKADLGDEIELTVARFGDMPVRVVWRNEHGMGCCFLDLPEEIIARIGHLLPASPAVDD